MALIKNIARKFVFPAAILLRGDKVVRALSNKNCLVLMFHGVTKKDTTWFSPRHLTSEQFENIITYLKSNFDIVDVATAFKIKSGEYKPTRKCVCITFDDGYVNNLEEALPILEKHKVNATFFISSMCTLENENSILWADMITATFLKNKDQSLLFNNRTFKNYIDVSSGEHIFEIIKKMSSEERDRQLHQFTNDYKVSDILKEIDASIWKLMIKAELKRFSSSPNVTIGSHGHMHYNLGDIEQEGAVRDLQLSKEILSNYTSKKLESIAYPDGSYSPAIKEIAKKNGFLYQFAVRYKSNDDITDYNILNRHGISSTTTLEANIIHLNMAFSKEGF